MRMRILAVVPLVVAVVAIVALWRLGLGKPASPGWGWPGIGLAGVIVLGAVWGSAALLGPRGRRRGWWLALPLALGLASLLGWARDRAHDDAAFARVRAAGSRSMIERYLRWGRHHRGEAVAMRDALVAAARSQAIEAARIQVAAARDQLAGTAGLDPGVASFLDGLLVAAADRPTTALMTFRPPVNRTVIAVEDREGEVYQQVATSLRALVPRDLVRLDLGGRIDGDPAAPVTMPTIEIAYEVRPWLVDGTQVVYARDGSLAALGLTPDKVYGAIELAFTIRLRRPGGDDGTLRFEVQPPERFEAHSWAMLLDQHGDNAIYAAMVDHAFEQLGARLTAALTVPP